MRMTRQEQAEAGRKTSEWLKTQPRIFIAKNGKIYQIKGK